MTKARFQGIKFAGVGVNPVASGINTTEVSMSAVKDVGLWRLRACTPTPDSLPIASCQKMRTKITTSFRGFAAHLCSNKPRVPRNLTTGLAAREVWMKDFGSPDALAERAQDRELLIQELVRDARIEMARIRAGQSALEALDMTEWKRTQLSAHNVAARAQALNLGILATCARELERFAAAVISGSQSNQAIALQNAAIAIEAVDLELSELSSSVA